MANFTKKAIKETFLELLEERPLAEITVKCIVEKCGINRNSFYYHYQDVPSLIEEIISEEGENIIHRYPSITSIVEAFDALVDFASRRKHKMMHIYHSISREVFEHYLMIICEAFVTNYVDTAFPQEEIGEEDKKSVITYFKCVCFGLIIDWLNQGMTEEHAHNIRRIFLLKKNFAMEIAELLQGQL